MEIKVDWGGKLCRINLERGVDLSIPFNVEFQQVNCFFAPFTADQPVKAETFTGSVASGGSVNFYNHFLNFHGGGTHTECYGHISEARESVNRVLREYLGMAILISVYPTLRPDGDRVIEETTLRVLLQGQQPTPFLVLRTLPNETAKQQRHYSGTNPPYLSGEAAKWIASMGFRHLLVDLPSVDRESDGGKLAAHRAFWSERRKEECTITELIYVPEGVRDGHYFINLQLAPIHSDAAPSRPVLFEVEV